MPAREYYVYVLFRPDGRPCYVGKGKGHRWLQHERRSGHLKNTYLSRIIEKAGGELPKVKVREELTNAEACEIEIALIRAIGRIRHGGTLANLTDGGEGSSGWIPSQSTRDKISAAHLALKKKLTPEQMIKLKAAVSASPKVKAAAAAMQQARIGTKLSAESRARMSVAKRKMTAATKAKMSASQKASAVCRARLAKMHAAPKSAETLVRMSEAQKTSPRAIAARAVLNARLKLERQNGAQN